MTKRKTKLTDTFGDLLIEGHSKIISSGTTPQGTNRMLVTDRGERKAYHEHLLPSCEVGHCSQEQLMSRHLNSGFTHCMMRERERERERVVQLC